MTIPTEFPGSALPAGWAAVTPGTSSVAVADGWLGITAAAGESYDSIHASSGINGAIGISHALPAGPFDIAVQLSDDIGDVRSWGYSLVVSDGAGGWARFAVSRPDSTAERPNFFGATRPTGAGSGSGGTNHFNTSVNNSPAALQSGTPAYLRLAFNGVDTFTPYYSTDGVTWVTYTAMTRALAPTTLYVLATSTTPNTAGTLRVAAVWDLLALGATDLRAARPSIARQTISSFDGTVGSLPANWADDSVTDAVTFTGTAVRFSSNAANVGSRARIRWTGTRYRSAGLLLRASFPSFDGNLFATAALQTDEGAGDVYVRDGGGYGLEVGNTARRPIRIDNPVGSNVASVPGSTGLDEKRYGWLRDTTGTQLSTGAPVRMYRIERICLTDKPGGRAFYRVKEWADAGSLAASLAAEPATWDLFEGQDDIERSLIGPVIVLAHNNPGGGLTGTGQMDLLHVNYYRVLPVVSPAARSSAGVTWASRKRLALGTATRPGVAQHLGATKRLALAPATRTAAARPWGAAVAPGVPPVLVEVTTGQQAAVTPVYVEGDAMPPVGVRWLDPNGEALDFGVVGWSFAARVGSPGRPALVVPATLRPRTPSITGPNLTVRWAPGELDALPPGRWTLQLTATLTAGGASVTAQVPLEVRKAVAAAS